MLISLIVSAYGDEIKLVNGTVYKAKEWWIEGEELILLTAEGRIRVQRARVKEIIIEGAETDEIDYKTPYRAIEDQQVSYSEIFTLERLAFPDEVLLYTNRGNIAAALLTLDAIGGAYSESDDYSLIKSTLLIQAGRFREAENLIRPLLNKNPAHSQNRFISGQAAYYQGKWSEALIHYRAVFPTIPDSATKNKIQARIAEMEKENHSASTRSENFIIRVTSLRELEVNDIMRLRESLERKYKEISDRLNYRVPQEILVVLTDSVQLDGAATYRAGAFDGRICFHAGLLSSAHRAETIAHELVHAVLFPRTAGNCPAWLHEGLAQLLSGLRSSEYREEIVSKLRGESQSMGLYPDSLTLLEFLTERYTFARVDTVLKLLADGVAADAAVIQAYGKPLDGIRRERDEWLRSRYTQ